MDKKPESNPCVVLECKTENDIPLRLVRTASGEVVVEQGPSLDAMGNRVWMFPVHPSMMAVVLGELVEGFTHARENHTRLKWTLGEAESVLTDARVPLASAGYHSDEIEKKDVFFLERLQSLVEAREEAGKQWEACRQIIQQADAALRAAGIVQIAGESLEKRVTQLVAQKEAAGKESQELLESQREAFAALDSAGSRGGPSDSLVDCIYHLSARRLVAEKENAKLQEALQKEAEEKSLISTTTDRLERTMAALLTLLDTAKVPQATGFYSEDHIEDRDVYLLERVEKLVHWHQSLLNILDAARVPKSDAIQAGLDGHLIRVKWLADSRELLSRRAEGMQNDESAKKLDSLSHRVEAMLTGAGVPAMPGVSEPTFLEDRIRWLVDAFNQATRPAVKVVHQDEHSRQVLARIEERLTDASVEVLTSTSVCNKTIVESRLELLIQRDMGHGYELVEARKELETLKKLKDVYESFWHRQHSRLTSAKELLDLSIDDSNEVFKQKLALQGN